MCQVNIVNLTKPFDQPLIAKYCQSFLCKLRGLAWRRSLPSDQGLLLVGTRESRLGSSIHMLGMNFDLTVVWLDSNLRAVDVQLARRWRTFTAPRKPARYVIECAASRFGDFQVGDQLAFQDA